MKKQHKHCNKFAKVRIIFALAKNQVFVRLNLYLGCYEKNR